MQAIAIAQLALKVWLHCPVHAAYSSARRLTYSAA